MKWLSWNLAALEIFTLNLLFLPGGSYSRNCLPVEDDPPPAEAESATKQPLVTAPVEATNQELRLEPSEPPACPAKSHINQCTCNFELELKG